LNVTNDESSPFEFNNPPNEQRSFSPKLHKRQQPDLNNLIPQDKITEQTDDEEQTPESVSLAQAMSS
jgi:hypothetical protein